MADWTLVVKKTNPKREARLAEIGPGPSFRMPDTRPAPILPDRTHKYTNRQISSGFKQHLVRARENAKLTRKQLAQNINEREAVIADYENGVGCADPDVVNKLNRALNTTLPKLRKEIIEE